MNTTTLSIIPSQLPSGALAAPPTTLHEVYLAVFKPDGGMTKRIKSLQNAAAVYEPGNEQSRQPLEAELSRLIGKPVQLSEAQLRAFKVLLIDEPAFAHLSPMAHLTASW